VIAVGVDGCRGGWFAVRQSRNSLSTTLYACFSDVCEDNGDATILVDIPMGLLDEQERLVEPEARKLLGSRRSSVFPVPCRDAVYASSYRDACSINLNQLGKKISMQAWNICPKIRDADAVRRRHPVDVQESHPELNFALLAGAPLQHTKKTPAGIAERLALLEAILPGAPALYHETVGRYPRSRLARDDIVDAMVLLATATTCHRDLLSTPQYDRFGIAVQLIVPC
jgi:predicted RNase H-like nuclease